MHLGPRIFAIPFARENRSRRKLNGNEEKGKKEETLTGSETLLRKRAKNFNRPLRDHLGRLFHFLAIV
jgi:hypothetical protein